MTDPMDDIRDLYGELASKPLPDEWQISYDSLMDTASSMDFPVVVDWRGGRTNWDMWSPHIFMDQDALAEYIEGNAPAEGTFDLYLYDAVEYIADLMNPDYRDDAQMLVDDLIAPNQDLYAYLNGAGYIDDGDGFKPEFEEDPEEL